MTEGWALVKSLRKEANVHESPVIELRGVNKSFGSFQILKDFSLSLKSNAIYCLIGESGSGKTTCLRLMNGLTRPNGGEVLLEGKAIDYKHVVYLRRKMGYAIQGSGLFPHLTVFENLILIAKRSGWSQENLKKRSREVLDMVNMIPDEVLNKTPSQLSGGQKQRVGIARSLFMGPKVMLMDEPFGALDPTTREEIQDLFLNLQKKSQLTVVIVTHDLDEAFKMADKIVLLHRGRVEQFASPSQLILNPASEYVTSYLRSYSPRQLLSRVKLYSVLDTNFWCVREEDDHLILKHFSEKEEKQFANWGDVEMFLRSKQSSFVVVLYQDGTFKSLRAFPAQRIKMLSETIQPLPQNANLINGMKSLFSSELRSIPVIDDQKKVIGCFSEGAFCEF